MKFRILAGALALSASHAAGAATCPPLSAYQVTGVSMEQGTLGEAMGILFDGTAWKADVAGAANTVQLSFRGVSGPLDKVFQKVVEQASAGSTVSLGSLLDAQQCVARVSVRARAVTPQRVIESGSAAVPAISPSVATVTTTPLPTAPAAAAAAAAPAPALMLKPAVLSKGVRLSSALEAYVKQRGWDLRWQIEEDYVLDADFPIPAMEIIDGVTWVVQAYQAQGGMRGVVPRFARGNNMVVIENMNVRDAN